MRKDSAAQTDAILSGSLDQSTNSMSRRHPVPKMSTSVSAQSSPPNEDMMHLMAKARQDEDLMHLMAKAREDNRDLWAQSRVGKAIEAQGSFTDWVDVTPRTKSSQSSQPHSHQQPEQQLQQPQQQQQPQQPRQSRQHQSKPFIPNARNDRPASSDPGHVGKGGRMNPAMQT